MLRRTIGTTTFLALLGLSCGTGEPARRAPDAPAPDVETQVAHRDPRLGLPSFVWLARGGDAASPASPSEAARSLLPSLARAFAVTPAASASISLAAIEDRGSGPVIARYEQRVGGVDVFRGGARVLMTRALRPVAASGFFAPTTRGAERPFALTSAEALAVGARALGSSGEGATAARRARSAHLLSALAPVGPKDDYERFDGPGLRAPARVKRVLYPVRGEDVDLEPAWYVELLLASGPAKAWIVSAMDGRVLLENDLVRHDVFSYRVYADPETKVPFDGPQGNAYAPHPAGAPDKRKLDFSPAELVTLRNYPFSKDDPWLAPSATTTSGNNVAAYADLASPDGLDASDLAPALSSAGAFDYVYDTDASAGATPASIQAATAHLFYVTNFLHDWYYDAGFDEASGNHQLDDFGRGGKGGDPLLAEAEDYSGRNNANAMVPPDGYSPRIQMFVFSGRSEASLVVTAPASIAGTKTVGIASGFGADVFDTTGSVVLAADGGGADPADGCEPLEGAAAGKIVLVHRGTCSFAQKAQAAEEAGAIGVVIANVASSAQPTVAPFMGGQQGGITIPVLSLSLADGQALEGAISAGATVTMKRSVGSDLDGALDTSIVAHEWGHVLSGRLVGDGMGLTTNQAGGLGEGWGDFTALLLTVRADDPGQFAGTYANGAYATSGSGDDIYFGTRRVPYSIDKTKNALTLKHIQNGVPLPAGVATSFGEDGSFNAEAHNTGEVWATMLWECYASLLRDRGLPFGEAQERMKRYLVASLKLTPPDPTILEARDAVLAAALATDAKDFQLFFEAFARRGAGAGAVGPAKDSTTNEGITESFEAGNALEIVEAKLSDDVISCDHDGLLDEGETGSIEVTVRNVGSGALLATTAQVLAKTEGATLLEPATASLAPLGPFETGKVKLAVKVKGTKQAEPIELDVAVSDPSLPEGRVVHRIVSTRYDADQAPRASTIDHVDTTNTVWKATGSKAGEKWARSSETGDGYWTVSDPALATDQKLTSPAFTIEGTTFTLAYRHKFSLKRSPRRNADLDGGVVELSVDGGSTWKDVSDYGAVDYNTTVDTGGRGDNPLKGRKAYGGASPGYPDEWMASRVDVTLPEHPESVRVRFRLGAASAWSGADGWFVDDIELAGISSTPFWAYVAHADACDPNGPSVDAGVPQEVFARSVVKLEGSATHPEDAPLTFQWSQVAGPPVELRDGASLTPSFVAPDVTAPTTITLSLRAHDGALLSAASLVDVIVDPAPAAAPAEDAGCSCRAAPARSSAAGALALAGLGVLLGRRKRRG